MEAIVEQALGNIHRGHALLARHFLERQDELVAGTPLRVGGHEAGLAQLSQQVVRIQRREFSYAAHAFAPQHAHVDIGTQQYAGIAHEAGQSPMDCGRSFSSSNR